MRHDRHYTLEQARAELPWVAQQLEAMRDARKRLGDADARRALAGASPGNGGGRPGKHVGEAFVELQAGVTEMAQREIVLRDLDRGLIDFPAIRDGREVYLCWLDGEADIAFWHDIDEGIKGRQAL